MVLVVMVLSNGVDGELFTAFVDIERLLHAEREVALQLRQFVSDQTMRLRQLTLCVSVGNRLQFHSGNSLDKLRHPRSDAYSAEQVLLNKQQIWCGGAYPDCYPNSSCCRTERSFATHYMTL